MKMSDDGVEKDGRWRRANGAHFPPRLARVSDDVMAAERPERRLLEVLKFGVLSPSENTGLAISASTDCSRWLPCRA
jgi:hypothetical protein